MKRQICSKLKNGIVLKSLLITLNTHKAVSSITLNMQLLTGFPASIYLPYSDKFWRGENLAQLAQNGKNRQIKSAPNLIFFRCTKLNPWRKNFFSNKKIEIFFHTLNLLFTEFLVCRTKQRFLLMFDYTLFRKKSLKNTNKILQSKIQSTVITFGLFGFLVSGFFVA